VILFKVTIDPFFTSLIPKYCPSPVPPIPATAAVLLMVFPVMFHADEPAATIPLKLLYEILQFVTVILLQPLLVLMASCPEKKISQAFIIMLLELIKL